NEGGAQMSHEHHGHDTSTHRQAQGTASSANAASEGHDHADHSHHDPGMFRRKFWLSLVLTIPTLVFSHGLQEILGLDGPRFAGSQFMPAVFGIALFIYGGTVFLKGGLQELKAKQPGMM